MLNIVVLEDNSEYLEVISAYIQDCLWMNNLEGQIILRTRFPSEVEKYIKKDKPNIFFIDIDLNSKINGIELAHEIKQRLKKPYIVFVTQHTKYVLLAFKSHAYDFLPKPVTKEQVNRCLLDIFNDLRDELINSKTEDSSLLTIKSGYKELFIKKYEILLIEKQGNKALIYTFNGQYCCYLALEYFEEIFANDKNFLRCHKSFIVNTAYIREIRFNKLEIELVTGKVCYMSRKYRKGLCL
ncbi:LytTR family DNA-binding domain-containing protein [Clostridium sp. BNL1100]|uniref:LytR/AlgR family response regulator transcription factor n=1 Tax=Clostridium sp. BNL1100 TaxID=755731 RepID=UPI00024A7B96|nr:LytTR family DNA-binding domain-containing protein [Clostridium sp. BNL1100]AEY66165.1 response regulator of the LytR/AlgR family [Clostridium sp. BNL1100]